MRTNAPSVHPHRQPRICLTAGDGDGPEGNQVAAPGATVARRVRDLLRPEDHPEPTVGGRDAIVPASLLLY